jgi:hypothetical protein
MAKSLSVEGFYPEGDIEGRNPLLDLCPFCGEAAEMFKEKKKYGVRCSNAECAFRPASKAVFDCDLLAIKEWNTRKGGR